MTIATSASQLTVLTDGFSQTFAFEFVGASASDLQLWLTTAGTGSVSVSTQLATGSYTVTLQPTLPGAIWGVGGTFTYPLPPISPLSSGSSLTIIRTLPYVQEVSISNQLGFYPNAVEIAADYEMMCIQQLEDQISRIIRVGPTDNPLDTLTGSRAGKCLAFDSNGNPILIDCAGTEGPPGPPGPGGLLNIRYLKSGSGTYTPTSGTSAIRVCMVGGGGGGGGGANADAAKASMGGGGGGGGYVEKFITSASASYSYSVGAGGAGGTAGNNGNDGGDTIFGSLSAFGGKKGSATNNFTPPAVPYYTYASSGLGGGATGGDINVPGETPSAMGGAVSDGSFAQVLSAPGGSSQFGMGAPAAFAADSSGQADAGIDATGYGAGGSGAAVGSSGTGKAGGAGSGGLIRIEEYA